MPALARGQANTPGILNAFITVNGTLTDAFVMEYRILDITAGLPGTQIFPTVPPAAPTYEAVTVAPGKFSTGSYYAYDNGLGDGWTPGLAEPIGTHRIEWRWKINASAPFQSFCEDFEVLVQSAGSSADLYCTVQDVRDAGLTDPPTDAEVLAAIEIWQSFLERACRQWFVPKAAVFKVDGNDSDVMPFGVPVIEIDYLRINNSETNLEVGRFVVYNGRLMPDDRKNPRVALVNTDDLDIFTAPLLSRNLRFRKGRQNQEIKGIFGYTEADGSVPDLIKRALLKLVIEKLAKPLVPPAPGTGPTPPPPIVGNLLEEVTDGHKRKYGEAGGAKSPRKPGMSGFTDDPEILDIITLYRAPIGIATPAHPSFK